MRNREEIRRAIEIMEWQMSSLHDRSLLLTAATVREALRWVLQEPNESVSGALVSLEDAMRRGKSTNV